MLRGEKRVAPNDAREAVAGLGDQDRANLHWLQRMLAAAARENGGRLVLSLSSVPICEHIVTEEVPAPNGEVFYVVEVHDGRAEWCPECVPTLARQEDRGTG